MFTNLANEIEFSDIEDFCREFTVEDIRENIDDYHITKMVAG